MTRTLAALAVLVAGLVLANPAGASRGTQVVEVEWLGSWYAAEVLASDGDQHLIHYVGYGTEWDEWVPSQRIRSGQQGATAPVIARGQWRVGDAIEVQWQNTWWAAEVVAVRGDQTLIHYVGYGAQWDEWVDDARIR